VTINVTSSLGPTSFQRVIPIGQLVVSATEGFDGVAAPAIPAGWSVTSSYAPMTFITTSVAPDSAPNAAFAADLPNCVNPGCPTTSGGSTELTSPDFPIAVGGATVTFRNRYNTESGWDGGVLEISIAGAAFQDILDGGGAFLQNGYNGTLGVSSPNPLGGRNAWSGDSGGYITSVVRLPASAAGQTVRLRWRMGSDSNVAPAGGGWNVDTISIAGQASCSFTPTSVKSRADFDGDGKSDPSVFRPSDNGWYLLKSNGGIDVFQWGLSGDQIVPGRYDSDNKADLAIFRPSESKWYVLGSNGFTISIHSWGLQGDKPVAGDYDGDGQNDPAIFRPSENKWYILYRSGGIQVQEWGLSGDVPVPSDYDGDGKTDFAVYRNGEWHVAFTGGGVQSQGWGLANDRPVPADYDGDDKDDLAVWRPSDGKWYVIQSSNGWIDVQQWGLTGDVPVPGDFDGDGRDERVVFRNGTWYILYSTGGIRVENWGLPGDVPIPAGYLP
jgi:hypothetical protein